MREPGRLVVYVTSHGFGHLNRAVSVVNLLPAEIPVTIRADENLFGHWKERLERPAELEAYSSDVGAVSPPGDSVATDGAATLALARTKHKEAVSRLDDEVARLQKMGAAAVLSDIPPLPLVAAKRAGVPALAMGNFTWSEIYEEHAEVGGKESRDFVRELRDCYAQADLLFRMSPGLEMAEFGEKRRDVGMVVTPGRSRREELRRAAGHSAHGPACVFLHRAIWPGNAGMEAATGDQGRAVRRFSSGACRAAAELARGGPPRVERHRPDGFGGRGGDQGRVHVGVRGDGVGHAGDLSSKGRVCRVSGCFTRGYSIGVAGYWPRPISSRGSSWRNCWSRRRG